MTVILLDIFRSYCRMACVAAQEALDAQGCQRHRPAPSEGPQEAIDRK